MHTNKANIAKGIGIAMAVGGATAMLSSTMMGSSAKRNAKRNMNKAVKAVGDIVGGIQSVMK
ncbi:MAG TPA: hypothetical protein IAD07_05565 [Candidatus Fimivicinus intestinavium]|nr:hypothetical protein [Candidatus Fimivicinus intestinavium]